MTTLKGVSLCLIKHQGIYNKSKVSFKFVLDKIERKQVAELYIGEDLSFFCLVFHFIII